jgi:hypothetical protein
MGELSQKDESQRPGGKALKELPMPVKEPSKVIRAIFRDILYFRARVLARYDEELFMGSL